MRRAAPFVLALAAFGCSRAPRSPEEAYRRFCEAVRKGERRALFAALDQKTRWAWMTVERAHREAYDIVLSTYPDGPERERELRRFAAGAESATADELFEREAAAAAIPMLVPLVVEAPRVETRGGRAEVVLPSNLRVPLAEGDDGSWGFAGLRADAALRESRALHDLDAIRTSAADYERAAARKAAGAR